MNASFIRHSVMISLKLSEIFLRRHAQGVPFVTVWKDIKICNLLNFNERLATFDLNEVYPMSMRQGDIKIRTISKDQEICFVGVNRIVEIKLFKVRCQFHGDNPIACIHKRIFSQFSNGYRAKDIHERSFKNSI